MVVEKLVFIFGVIFLVLTIGGFSACDVRQKKFELDMAEKGFCKMPYSTLWVPCERPILVKE